MKVRKVVDNEIVWFNSYGKDSNGLSKKVNNNFSENKDYVRDSLTQKLSVIEGELWYNIMYGLPLISKVHSKSILDMSIANIILAHEDVSDILSFESSIKSHKYIANITIKTNYGNILLNI